MNLALFLGGMKYCVLVMVHKKVHIQYMNYTFLLLRSLSSYFSSVSYVLHLHYPATPTAPILENLILLSKWTVNCERIIFL